VTPLLWVGLVVAVCAGGYWLFLSPFSQAFGAYPYRGPRPERGASSDPVVALTFDDGPNEPYTSQILDYLATKNIRATFFQVGNCVERFPETTDRIHAAGHIIGNHSLSHSLLTYLRRGHLEQEIQRTQVILQRHLGRTPALFRSPWLWRQPMLLRMLRQYSLQPVSGEFCHAFEVFQPDAARMARRAVAKTKPGSILIFHDGFDDHGGDRGRTVEAVKITVETLLDRGYRFTTVDELLQVPAYL